MPNATVKDPAKTRKALTRFKVMAIVTGSFLLLVTLGVILKYVVGWDNEMFLSINTGIDIVHGWIYVIYLLTVADLWSKMRWGFGRLVYMVLGGVVPFLSFFAERRVAADVAGTLDS